MGAAVVCAQEANANAAAARRQRSTPLIRREILPEEAIDFLSVLISEDDFGELEALAIKPAPDAFKIAFELDAILLRVRVPNVADVFEEERREDVVLIHGRIDRSAERVAGLPDGGVDVLRCGDLHVGPQDACMS